MKPITLRPFFEYYVVSTNYFNPEFQDEDTDEEDTMPLSYEKFELKDALSLRKICAGVVAGMCFEAEDEAIRYVEEQNRLYIDYVKRLKESFKESFEN